MSQKVYPVQQPVKDRALIDRTKYDQWYAASVSVPDAFWAEHGKRIDWFKPFSVVKNTSFTGDVSIKWFEDGETNVSYTCIDRHLDQHGDRTAIIFEGDTPYIDRKITYRELHEHVCRMANVMKKYGVLVMSVTLGHLLVIPTAVGFSRNSNSAASSIILLMQFSIVAAV